MIYANVTLSIEDHLMKADKNIILYRGDKNVEIRFILKRNKFVILENTYAQMIIKRPSARSIFSQPAFVKDNTVVFTITGEMIDELTEIGEYTFQIRLFDDNMVARATLPPCEGCLIIKRPIAVEGEALINVAMINDSAIMAATDVPAVAAHIPAPAEIPAYDPWAENTPAVAADIPEDQIFDENNSYNRTVWVDGDIITDARMNKIENALYQIKENAGSITITAPYISTFLPENIIVNGGDDFELDIEFRSQNLGNGTLKVFINDVDSLTQRIDQGITTTMVSGSLFTKGTNMVVVYVLDRAGVMTNSLTFYIRYGGLEITQTFDPYVAYDYGASVRYYFIPTSLDTSIPLTFYMEIDGVVQEGLSCVSDIRSSYDFPTNLPVGNHYCRAWISDGTNESNPLTFNLIILDSTSLVVASDTLNPSVEEGDQLSLDYRVYMKNNSSFITKTYVDNEFIGTGTCTLETAYYRTASLKEGVHTVRIEVYDVTERYSDFVVWNITITPSTYELLAPASAGSIFMASAYNKSNTDEDRQNWVGTNEAGEVIAAPLTNFAFNSENGWVDDSLIISGNSWVEVPVKPLTNNAQYGFTLDIEFSTRPIGAEDAEVLTLWNDADNCGIKITTEQLIIRSKNGNQADLYFSEDEVVSAIFVIDRDEKTAKIYLNGVACEAFALSDYEAAGQKVLEDFTVNSNVYLGGYNKNGYCAIKNLRIYNIALSTNEILNNYMSNEKNKLAQKELVEFQKGNTLPTLTIYCDFSGLGKDDKKPCDIVYNSPDVNLYGESFRLDGKYSTLQYQGTSSMQYPIKNYRINPADANGKVKLDPFKTGVPESRFTLKADYMSSGHWQNTGLAKWVNDNLYNYKTNDPSTMNARKWYDLQNGGSLDDTRESIAGFPCRLILVNDGNTTLTEGQQEPTPGNTKDMGIFNFNNDKDNVSTMGLDTDIFPNSMSFEVAANSDTSAGAFVPYTSGGTEWTFADIGTVSIYETSSAYSSSYIPISALSSCPVITPSLEGTWRFYNEAYTELKSQWVGANATYDFTTILSENPSAKYIRYVKYAKDGMKTYTVNDITFIPISTTGTGSEEPKLKEPLYIERGNDPEKELEYLQASFELRHPDADDYGSDYGYLGLMEDVEHLYLDYADNYGNNMTPRIPVDYFGTNVIDLAGTPYQNNSSGSIYEYDESGAHINTTYATMGATLRPETTHFSVVPFPDTIVINGLTFEKGDVYPGGTVGEPYTKVVNELTNNYGLKRVIDWVGNATDEQFVAEFDQYFHRDYTLRYYLLVIVLGMVDNLGKNMMLDTFDGKIWLPRFYDMDTICSYDNSGEIKFDVDIEMEQGYWNTSASRLWTKIRDLMHDELVLKYNDMRQNGMNFDSFMSYFYGQQISKIPQTYYNKDFDVKYAPYADEYMGKAHGDGYEHLKRWLKRRLIFTDTLFDYGPSYETDTLTIRANTLDLMSLEIETYTPVYQHVSFYNGNMEKIKINSGSSAVFQGYAQTATDQEVLIYGGSNIKKIKGLQSMNPNSMLLGKGTRITELDLSNCPILTIVNSNKANFSPHTYLNKLDISNCPQLGGTLNVSNSPLLQEINALGTAVDNIQFNPSLRNLQTLRVPKNVSSLTLTDAGMLRTIEMEQGHNLQNLALTNCNNLTETINFDLTNISTVSLDNSFNVQEVYMRNTTNLTLRNMSNLERVIFTPNSECSQFDINNVINGPNYKITTFNNPKMKDFITTAPHRFSYNNIVKDVIDIEGGELIDGTHTTGGYWTEDGVLSGSSGFAHQTVNVETGVKTLRVKTSGMTSSEHVRVTYFKDSTFIKRDLIAYPGTQVDQDIIVPEDCNKIIFVSETPCVSSCYCEPGQVIIKHYGDILPNSVFTANTLDLADTQFENVKFLCTTDIYNLKVPTTMKNFYCDSAYDIDTDVIEDASYEVTHEELIEPYTTNYESEVKRVEDFYWEGYPRDDNNLWISGKHLDKWTGTVSDTTDTDVRITDYIGCSGNSAIAFSCSQNYVVEVCYYDKNKTYITYRGFNDSGGWTDVTPTDAVYIRVRIPYAHLHYSASFQRAYTPNIIPSSASGSLIFNMYSNNTTKPTSTSPYMWDLTGLKLNDFYTYGMNNWVKPNDDSYVKMLNARSKWIDRGYAGNVGEQLARGGAGGCVGLSPIKATTGDVFTLAPTFNDDVCWGYICTDDNFQITEKNGAYLYKSKSITVSNPNTTRIYLTIYYYMIAHPTTDEVDVNINGKNLRYSRVEPWIDINAIKVLPPIDMDDFDTLFTGNPSSITMPHRMPGYSVRMVNADITPDEYPTMFYPLLVDANLPITGRIDYGAYKGTSLAWAYAFTTDDVGINPVNSQNIGQITCDFNKLYSTDFVDLTDVWIYKDTDISKLTTNEKITKMYIELTDSNRRTRTQETIVFYPNAKEIYYFDDGTVWSLENMYTGTGSPGQSQMEKVVFMEGYFKNIETLARLTWYQDKIKVLDIRGLNSGKVTNMSAMCMSLVNLEEVIGLDTFDLSKVNHMGQLFYNCSKFNKKVDLSRATNVTTVANMFEGCYALTHVPVLPPNVTNMHSCFKNCTSLTTPPAIPNNVENMDSCFSGCTKLTTAPTIPKKANVMGNCFYNCDSLTEGAVMNTEVIEYGSTYRHCDNLISATIPVGKSMSYDYQRIDTFLDSKKLENVSFVGKTRTSIDFAKCFKITGSNAAPVYWTNVGDSVKDLVNNHLYNFSEARIRNDGSSYIDIPFEDMDYNNIYDMEVRCDVNSSGGVPIIGANGTYNMCVLTVSMVLRETNINMFGTVGKIGAVIDGIFYNGDVIRYNRNGIYYNGELVQEHTIGEFNRNVINEDKTPFRLFGKAGYQACITPGDSIYHVTFRDEQGNVIMHLEPYNGPEGVGFKNTVTNKVYTNSGGGTLTYVDYVDSGQSIILGETLLSYLTEDEIEQATAKGWTIQ